VKPLPLTLSLLASSLLSFAAEPGTPSDTTQAPAAPAPELSRERISARIIEAYNQNPDQKMMVPKTGEQSITQLVTPTKKLEAPDSSDAAKAKAELKKSAEPVVGLAPVTVQGRKETETTWEAKRLIHDYEKQIEAEKARTEATSIDEALNNPKLSIMGEGDAKARENDAKRRIHELEVKESVAAVATDPKSEEENKKLLKMLQDLEYQKKQY